MIANTDQKPPRQERISPPGYDAARHLLRASPHVLVQLYGHTCLLRLVEMQQQIASA